MAAPVLPPKPEPDPNADPTPIPKLHLRLTHHHGDIFDAPPGTLLIHACNTQGSWGAGIALEFKKCYPAAYAIYHSYCTITHNLRKKPVPTGTCLLIPPCDGDKQQHWIGCLFTSARYGRGKDGPEKILESTARAVRELLREVGKGKGIEGVRMCRINSGKFGVEWERTVSVLEGVEVEEGWRAVMEVWSIE